LTISETLRHGLIGGLRVAAAPLLTDGALILLTALLLERLSDQPAIMGAISIAGGLLLFCFAWECFRPVSLDIEEAKSHSLLKAVLVNLTNPAPYLFWLTLGTPTLLRAREESAIAAIAYLAGFFLAICGAKVIIALITARFRDFLRGRAYRIAMALLGLALVGFGIYFMLRGLGQLDLYTE